MDPTDIKCPLQWWGKHETMFPTFDFLTHQILSIVGSQIEQKEIFSLMNILTNLRKCCLTIIKLKKIDFCEQEWAKCS